MEYDPDYLAAIEREQCRLIDRELERLRFERMRASGLDVPRGDVSERPMILAALRETVRMRDEQAAFATQRAQWRDDAAQHLARIERHPPSRTAYRRLARGRRRACPARG